VLEEGVVEFFEVLVVGGAHGAEEGGGVFVGAVLAGAVEEYIAEVVGADAGGQTRGAGDFEELDGGAEAGGGIVGVERLGEDGQGFGQESAKAVEGVGPECDAEAVEAGGEEGIVETPAVDGFAVEGELAGDGGVGVAGCEEGEGLDLLGAERILDGGFGYTLGVLD
jgi:hypothetical protein